MNPRDVPRIPIWIGVAVAVLAVSACGRKTAVTSAGGVAEQNESSAKIFQRELENAWSKADAPNPDSESLRRLARLQHANDRYAEALASYQRLATLPGGLSARDHYYIADIRLNQSDLAGAETELRAVLAAEPRYLPARLSLATVLFKLGREGDAEKEYAAALLVDPENPSASLGIARLELQRGDDAAAVARLERLMAAHHESTSGAALLAQVLQRRGETERAAALSQWSRQKPEPIPPDPWMSALEADTYDLRRLGLRFEDYFKTGQIAEALPLMQRFEELDPQSPIPPMLKGWAAAQSHRDEEAVQQYRVALAKGGSAERICPFLVPSLLALGKISEAAQVTEEQYAKNPGSIPLAIACSDVAIRRGDEKRARRLLEKILEKEPYLSAQNMNLAKILWTAGDRDGAAVCLQRVARVYARDVPSRALLGEYFLGKSDPDSAVKVLEEANGSAATAGPEVSRGINALLASAYLQTAKRDAGQERWTESLEFFEKAIRLAPEEADGYAGKAIACVQLKRFRDAIATLNKLAELQPKNPTVYLSLGDVLALTGDRVGAKREWEKARSLVAVGDGELRAEIERRLMSDYNMDSLR